MNVLFISAVLPYPLYSGGQTRIYNLVKNLSQKHTITLVSFIRNENEKEFISHLNFCARVETIYRGRAWNVRYLLKAAVTSYPFLYSTYSSNLGTQLIKNILKEQQIDFVHIEPGYVFPVLPPLNKPLVVAEHNIEHQVYEGYLEKYKFPLLHTFMHNDVEKMKTIEKKIWQKSDARIVVSEEDNSNMEKISGKTASIIQNGVDIDFFRFIPKNITELSLKFIFVGNFRWIQNKDAIQRILIDIWPRIKHNYPNAILTIVGQDFPDALRKHIHEGIFVEEYINDIRDAYDAADILLAPLAIGGGTKYKILEAMASGLPVITTTKGIEGMPVKNRVHVYIADSSEEYIQAIDDILKQVSQRTSILSNARTLIEKQYSWTSISESLDKVWSNIL